MSVEELRDEVDEHQEDVGKDIDTEMDDDAPTDDDAGAQDADDVADDNQDDDDSETLNFSFDDDDDKDPYAGQAAPDWVKQQRKENRELKRQLAELQKQHGQPEQQALREKPTLDAHDYDSEAFEQDYAQWVQEKQQHEAKVQAEQQKYQRYDDNYKSSVDKLRAKAPDYDDIEQSIVDAMPVQRQAYLKMLTKDPAKLVYALGKSPKKLGELSSLDEAEFIREIVLLEHNMATGAKRNPNKPKPKTHSLEGAAGGGDAQLAKLEAEAAKTGDRSKIYAYKRNQK